MMTFYFVARAMIYELFMTFGFARKFISRLESFLPIDPVLVFFNEKILLIFT